VPYLCKWVTEYKRGKEETSENCDTDNITIAKRFDKENYSIKKFWLRM